MKKYLILFLFIAISAHAAPGERLVKYVPRFSYIVIGADFQMLRDNDVFLSMERQGQVWSYDEDSDITKYFRLLGIDGRKDVTGFVFCRYVNPYGSSGKIHMFSVTKDVSPFLQQKASTKYLNSSMYRLLPDDDMYAVQLDPGTVALGDLNEAKLAIDVSRQKVPPLAQNPSLSAMYQKLSPDAAVWSVALPLARRNAAQVKAKQSTNAVIGGFESYYWYAVPTKSTAHSHFFGQAHDEDKAQFINSFMIGILMVAKIRAHDPLAGMLDQIDIKQNGNTVHVSAVITKEMVDAFFKGDLGI